MDITIISSIANIQTTTQEMSELLKDRISSALDAVTDVLIEFRTNTKHSSININK
jgi:hypothetical protein